MRLFISQPMNGRSDEEILAERKQLMQFAKNKLCEIDLKEISSFIKHTDDAKPLVYLGMAIQMLADADYVVFAKGWEHSRGCVIEHECAVRYGKEIIYV